MGTNVAASLVYSKIYHSEIKHRLLVDFPAKNIIKTDTHIFLSYTAILCGNSSLCFHYLCVEKTVGSSW